jgi:hypothetical protein
MNQSGLCRKKSTFSDKDLEIDQNELILTRPDENGFYLTIKISDI